MQRKIARTAVLFLLSGSMFYAADSVYSMRSNQKIDQVEEKVDHESRDDRNIEATNETDVTTKKHSKNGHGFRKKRHKGEKHEGKRGEWKQKMEERDKKIDEINSKLDLILEKLKK